MANLTAVQLLDVLTWEFSRQALLHNGPFQDPGAVQDDSDMVTTLTNGYLQNVCQRYVLGVETSANFAAEGAIMEKYMHYKPFHNLGQPTLREANDRVMYLATNWQKTDVGNLIYGEITYAINPLYKDKFFVSPFDTGAYSGKYGPKTPFGTLDDFFHLVEPHLQMYGGDHPGYGLAAIFQRWYGGRPLFGGGSFFYFEIGWSGNAWLPEALLYIVPKFSKLWGTDDGRQLQHWCMANKRPLIWADAVDSGAIIDPVVNQLAFGVDPPYITPNNTDIFDQLWKPGLAFSQLVGAVDPALRFLQPSWLTRQACEPHEHDPLAMVMGTNGHGQCVYWEYTDKPIAWECLNDGTCGLSLGSRGTYFSEHDCLAACGQGKWACLQNTDRGAGYAGSNAKMCTPNPLGKCSGIGACESACR